MKAISPVIATVIIVAVAIALAIAVALWITGVIGGVSRMERLDITAAYYNRTVDIRANSSTNWYNGTFYEIILEISNKGSVATTIDRVFINNKPYSTQLPTPAEWNSNKGYDVWFYVNGNLINITARTDIHVPINETTSDDSGCYVESATLNPGENTKLWIYLDQDTYKSGQIVQIIVHTATGGQYPAQVTLP